MKQPTANSFGIAILALLTLGLQIWDKHEDRKLQRQINERAAEAQRYTAHVHKSTTAPAAPTSTWSVMP